jgi:hypothetical protein
MVYAGMRARQALRKLLASPARLVPVVAGDGRKTYRFEGETTVGPLLPPAFITLASPRGSTRDASCLRVPFDACS